MDRRQRLTALLTLVLAWLPPGTAVQGDVPTPVPAEERGTSDAERAGTHDASNIRTVFWNYGMVGDYPADPGNVDLSVFHSVEVPKGSGMNYSDGITPFVLAKIQQVDGSEAFIMETGFRERQGISPYFSRVMRFEPRPGYLQTDTSLNPGRSPAISNDPRTWPDFWPDRLDDPDDPGWRGSWNGYFGKQVVADQESYTVMDDQYYDAWNFYPDSRDSTRRGLGLRIEVRGFQWANPQARNVIFWHYDITNEGTTLYDDNIVFGLYMDSGVGGSALSCDGIFESDDDNAFFDPALLNDEVLNLVYTWDRKGHGRDLASSCSLTGYLGYAYLETPGSPDDLVDNDLDGITDERRDGGPGQLLEGTAAIEAYVAANYDLGRFEIEYGPLADLPAYRAEAWWTGDEDLDWTTELHDLGADGLADTGDTGEGDGIPTEGEPNFDRTDLNESDQIGLTGFKINRIRPGQDNPNQTVDDILFFTTPADWPRRLYEQFSDPDPDVRFDQAVSNNYNIGFLFASGPFTLRAGQTERFSLALAYGADLEELRGTVRTVQQIYDANYRFAVPPPIPIVTAEEGDGFVRLSWSEYSERSADPVTGEFDFEGYRIYRSTDPEFRDPKVITTGTGSGPIGNGRPIAQFDLVDGRRGFSDHVVEGVSYFLGTDTGLTHTWTDYSVTNGQTYYYAVCAYDYGSDRLEFYPSENAITVSRTKRGETILPPNVVEVRPNPRAAGYVSASASTATQIEGRGTGTVQIEVVNSNLVRQEHLLKIDFSAAAPESVAANAYALIDSTTGEILFTGGRDLRGVGVGPVGAGLLPIVTTPTAVAVDEESTAFTESSPTDAVIAVSYTSTGNALRNVRRPGFPDDITVRFSDSVLDTSLAGPGGYLAVPSRFEVIAHGVDGDLRLDFQYRDRDGDGTLSGSEQMDVFTYLPGDPSDPKTTWRLQLTSPPQRPLGEGDVFELRLTRPFGENDAFVFHTLAARVDPTTDAAKASFAPYVVPNPYMGSASFEPERFAVSGRGERRIEFRGLPARCSIRIYNVRGELVQTLQHEGTSEGYVGWDLRTRDNLDVAPGLYLYHVDGGNLGTFVGKFGVVK